MLLCANAVLLFESRMPHKCVRHPNFSFIRLESKLSDFKGESSSWCHCTLRASRPFAVNAAFVSGKAQLGQFYAAYKHVTFIAICEVEEGLLQERRSANSVWTLHEEMGNQSKRLWAALRVQVCNQLPVSVFTCHYLCLWYEDNLSVVTCHYLCLWYEDNLCVVTCHYLCIWYEDNLSVVTCHYLSMIWRQP